jgi:hypothetical protein
MAGRYCVLSLFGECPLPGCRNPVDDPRWPCGECERELAGYIRPARRPDTREQAAADPGGQDQDAAAQPAPARPGPSPAPRAGADRPGTERKANQLCWCCEQRRRCRPDPGHRDRWICPDCEAIS